MVYKGVNLDDTLCGWQKFTFSDDSYNFINWTGKFATQTVFREETKESFKNSIIYSTYICKFTK